MLFHFFYSYISLYYYPFSSPSIFTSPPTPLFCFPPLPPPLLPLHLPPILLSPSLLLPLHLHKLLSLPLPSPQPPIRDIGGHNRFSLHLSSQPLRTPGEICQWFAGRLRRACGGCVMWCGVVVAWNDVAQSCHISNIVLGGSARCVTKFDVYSSHTHCSTTGCVQYDRLWGLKYRQEVFLSRENIDPFIL